jgi:uncharacterized coiled-coil protein SlyX
VAIGDSALFTNTASGNTAVGSNALMSNTTGGTLGNIQGFDVGPNVAVGWQALESNTVASANTAVGYQALRSFTAGPAGFEQLGLCTAVGFQALANATTGIGNSGFGYGTLYNDTFGFQNTATGAFALFSDTEGINNTANGFNALFFNTTGTGNTAIGRGALANSTIGNFNTALGDSAGISVSSASNVISIGISGDNVDNSCFIGNIRDVTTNNADAINVVIDHAGQLGTVSSSRRFKHDIKPMDKASESILALKPVTFHYNTDKANRSQFGLIAEEVAEVNPDLVVRNKNGEIYTVRYDQVNAMLLNEFLKEHKRVEEQGCKLESQGDVIQAQQGTIAELKSVIAQQQKGMETLTAQLNEQSAQIQKVSAQVEMTKAAPKVVLSNR